MIAVANLALASRDAGEFQLHDSDAAKKGEKGDKGDKGATKSKISATRTEAAMKFTVVDKENGPITGVVICLTGPTETKYCTDETDAAGYAEVLVPVGQKYDVTYLSLGGGDVATSVTVTNEPKQNIKLTLRYKRPPPRTPFVLKGVNFDTGTAVIRDEAAVRLDLVVDFMKHRKSASVEISGHTDNVGNAKTNKTLSLKRAQACRTYLISKGIEGDRITAVGFGGERPVGPNDSDENRQKNRRIEVVELQSHPAGAKGAKGAKPE
jgi:outer membrane protein OmpA-like peptidoglycan-associated protein